MKPPRRMTENRRLAELRAFIDLCFFSMDEPDLKKISNRTGLCVSTLYRLRTGNATLLMRVGTLQALGIAAGLKLELTQTRARVLVLK